MTGNNHPLIVKTAMQITMAFYDNIAGDPAFRAEWPKPRLYVLKKWPLFVKDAREQLTNMLTGNYPEDVKAEIYAALLHDIRSHQKPRQQPNLSHR